MPQEIDVVKDPPQWNAWKGSVIGMFDDKQVLYPNCGKQNQLTALDCSGSMHGVPHYSVSYFIPSNEDWKQIQVDIYKERALTRVSDVIINMAVHMTEETKGARINVFSDGKDNNSNYAQLPPDYEKTFEGALSFFVDTCGKFKVSPNVVVICVGYDAQALANRISTGTGKRVAVGVCTPEMTKDEADAVCRFVSAKATTSHKASLAAIGLPNPTKFDVVDLTEVVEQQKEKHSIFV